MEEIIDLKICKPKDDCKQYRRYTMEQYTPHIHFQNEERSACLRSSEVKPKLDRFIIDYVEKRNKTSIPEKWKLKSEDKNKSERQGTLSSLDYKMHIIGNGKPKRMKKPGISSYFGDMGAGPKKEFIFYADRLTMTIETVHTERELTIANCEAMGLLDLIDYVLPAFFSLHCFGTRSTKGWGSYGIYGRNVTDEYLLDFKDYYYKADLKQDEKQDIDWENQLDVIRILSNMMKGGFNFKGYYKGRIFRYYTEKGIGSDKAYMKQKILPGELDKNKGSESRISYKKFVYSRGALGLAGSYEFRSGQKTDRRGKIGVFDIRSKKVGGAGEDEVCRFNNPVHFVSRGNEILIVPTEIPEALKKAQFEFVEIDESGIPKKQNARKEVADKGTMRIPEDFDLEKFLDYFMGEFNNKKDIDGLEKCIFKSIGATWIKKGEIQKMSGGKKLV